ncbi:VOC family protein [Paenibacillus sp. NPDC056579]|uniref:VOC family protein n=1 Tax=Paenibacillus sp. NPDC056579 TaxID=3345871 RepID=UPI0036CAD30A
MSNHQPCLEGGNMSTEQTEQVLAAALEKPIFSIDHVQIPIAGNLLEAAEWYKKILGVEGKPPKLEADAWFAGVGRGNIMLWKTNDVTSKANFMKNEEEMPVIMFKTFQIDSIHEKLLEEGARIVKFVPAKEDPKGHWRFLKFYDPWGNMLGFIQDPPDVPWYGTR